MMDRVMVILAIAAILVSCGRNLTPNEAAFLGTVQGNNIEYEKVRIVRGGVQDLRKGFGAMATGNVIHFNRSNYRNDFVPTGPGEVSYLEDRILLAHEATHVWQFQNLDLTGCTLGKMIDEHRLFKDHVYEYSKPPSPSKAFLSYRCEQQAEIVGDWVELRERQDPSAPIYERLIRSAMPVDKLLSKFGAARITSRLQ